MAPAADGTHPALTDLPSQAGLPDLLTFLDGTRADPVDWPRRRDELADLLQHYEYGYLPAPVEVATHARFTDPTALAGTATLTELDLTIGDAPSPVRLLLAVPNAGDGPFPTFVGPNFEGNHTVLDDDRIATPNALPGYAKAGRGGAAGKWPLEQIVAAGYAVATFYAGDVDLDDPATRDAGIRPFVDTLPVEGDAAPGSLAVWAWALQRAVDVLHLQARIDPDRLIAIGHSRFGKVAILAAAFDDRIAAAIPHQAGGGGTSPARSQRADAEPLSHLATAFPYWFTPSFPEVAAEPQKLPYDHHALLALMAPRPILLSNATGDTWADPLGQLQLRTAARPAYELLDAADWADRDDTTDDLPPVGEMLPGRIGFWLREGVHAATPADWSAFIAFADDHLPATTTPTGPEDLQIGHSM